MPCSLVEANPLERGEGLASIVAREGVVQGDAGDELLMSRGPAPLGEGEGAAPPGAGIGELDALGNAFGLPEDPLEGEVEIPGRDLVARSHVLDRGEPLPGRRDEASQPCRLGVSEAPRGNRTTRSQGEVLLEEAVTAVEEVETVVAGPEGDVPSLHESLDNRLIAVGL